MTVTEPLGYDVDITTEELDIIIKCKRTLQNIVEILEEKRCDTLEAEYEDYTETIDLEMLNTMITGLDTLMSINRMY